MKPWWIVGLVGGVLAVAQAASAQSVSVPTVCSVTGATRALSADVRETSGLARGGAHPDVLWTHNDSGNQPEIYAIGEDGSARARVSVSGVVFTDWEDLAAGPCATGYCLYIADIGDNAGRRSHISIYELPEPALSATTVAATRVIEARYADGPQDAEGLFRVPSGEFYIVTKGRQKSIRLYQLSMAGADGRGTLQLVREIAPQPTAAKDRITAATASPNGEWVAIRSYANLYLYRTADLLRPDGAPTLTFSLLPLAEKQGESVTLADDGTIWMTSEAGRKKDLPTMASVKCNL